MSVMKQFNHITNPPRYGSFLLGGAEGVQSQAESS